MRHTRRLECAFQPCVSVMRVSPEDTHTPLRSRARACVCLRGACVGKRSEDR